MSKKTKKATDFQIYLNKQLKNKSFNEIYHEYGKQLEVAYQISKLRKQAKITQSELAKKISTTQSNIARMGKGQQNFTIGTLNKIALTFNRAEFPSLQAGVNGV